MNSEKVKKIEAEIAKMKTKISDYTARLRELERQKTELENAGIIALVRDMDILPEELTAFIQAFKQKSTDNTAVLPTMPPDAEKIQNNMEGLDEEK